MRASTKVLHVWGDLACFSRPELKVERFSYPIITPSAARGIFDAVYCKPTKFRWQIAKVEVLKPPEYIALRRNEVKDRADVNSIASWIAGRARPVPIWADLTEEWLGTDKKGRTQRQTMALRDVDYRLHAEIRPWPGFEASLDCFSDQFDRRASRGKCAFQPCFGCREFPAYFEQGRHDSEKQSLSWTQDLGWMLYDVFDLSRPGVADDRPSISLFQASVDRGVMLVPDYSTDLVSKGTGGGA
jgi:CRISPR-associated protein Cas5d